MSESEGERPFAGEHRDKFTVLASRGKGVFRPIRRAASCDPTAVLYLSDERNRQIVTECGLEF